MAECRDPKTQGILHQRRRFERARRIRRPNLLDAVEHSFDIGFVSNLTSIEPILATAGRDWKVERRDICSADATFGRAYERRTLDATLPRSALEYAGTLISTKSNDLCRIWCPRIRHRRLLHRHHRFHDPLPPPRCYSHPHHPRKRHHSLCQLDLSLIHI